MLALALTTLLAATPPTPAAMRDASPLAALGFLAGHCWQGRLGDGKATDTHCFQPLHAPHFLRDRHVVCAEGKAVYAGETTYLAGAAGKRIQWRYLSSAGLVMDGQVERVDATLRFLGSTATNTGGHDLRATWTTAEGEVSYRAVTEARQTDGRWKVQSDVEFVRIDGGAPCTDGGKR